MSSDKTPDYAKIRTPLLRQMMQYPLPALVSHWMFQSLFYMDRTERLFKLALDTILTGGLFLIMMIWLKWPVAWLVGFFLAHTLNFLFNGQLWGVLKQYGFVHTTRSAFDQYVQGLGNRARQEPAIQHLLIYGSEVRQEWTPSSDLDARLVRHPGMLNGLRACWFVMKERSRALFAKFPLDMYVIDNIKDLNKLRSDERPMDIFVHPQ